ncbi:hypothetical protein [Nonomuraea aurantiaca]|jgi:hypothetical protein|uniref:hypothetical protein n=1 Tax=Nonomuraea aurantiaca TaxID=2878562 RepID=UPI001CD94FFB|nr:hypothetical protein [Nonomuraea aurantiaca]MCA2220830.1 hypothetical protein [Nonomuraea aurantiaca]
MRRWLARIKDQADAVIALILAVVFSVLGVLEAVPGDVINNTILVTLAVLAFSLLRDRWRKQETGETALRRFSELIGDLDDSLYELREVRRLGGEMAPVYGLLRGAFRYNQRSPLEIELSLSSVWSNQRFDRYNDYLLITVRDKGWPAYRIRSNAKLYADYSTHLSVSFRQARAVRLSGLGDSVLAEIPSTEEIRQLFDQLHLPLHSYTDHDIAHIRQQALTPTNPYGD